MICCDVELLGDISQLNVLNTVQPEYFGLRDRDFSQLLANDFYEFVPVDVVTSDRRCWQLVNWLLGADALALAISEAQQIDRPLNRQPTQEVCPIIDRLPRSTPHRVDEDFLMAVGSIIAILEYSIGNVPDKPTVLFSDVLPVVH